MLDYLYRIVPFYRNWSGMAPWGLVALSDHGEMKEIWKINRRDEAELTLATMLEF